MAAVTNWAPSVGLIRHSPKDGTIASAAQPPFDSGADGHCLVGDTGGCSTKIELSGFNSTVEWKLMKARFPRDAGFSVVIVGL